MLKSDDFGTPKRALKMRFSRRFRDFLRVPSKTGTFAVWGDFLLFGGYKSCFFCFWGSKRGFLKNMHKWAIFDGSVKTTIKRTFFRFGVTFSVQTRVRDTPIRPPKWPSKRLQNALQKTLIFWPPKTPFRPMTVLGVKTGVLSAHPEGYKTIGRPWLAPTG